MSDFIIENGILKKYTGPAVDVVIPRNVTTIDDTAFRFCTGLTSITIPASVITIDESAFKQCTGKFVSNELKGKPEFLLGVF